MHFLFECNALLGGHKYRVDFMWLFHQIGIFAFLNIAADFVHSLYYSRDERLHFSQARI